MAEIALLRTSRCLADHTKHPQSFVPPELDDLERARVARELHHGAVQSLMQQTESFDIDSSTFIRFLENTVWRFQCETGISARFVSEVDEAKMPQRVCREVVRIVQAGLVNVRKHITAQHVLVRLTATDSHWQVTIEDKAATPPQ